MAGTTETHVQAGGEVPQVQGKGREGGEAGIDDTGSRVGSRKRELGRMEVGLEFPTGYEVVETGAGVPASKRGRGRVQGNAGGRDADKSVGAARGPGTAEGEELGKNHVCRGPVQCQAWK